VAFHARFSTTKRWVWQLRVVYGERWARSGHKCIGGWKRRDGMRRYERRCTGNAECLIWRARVGAHLLKPHHWTSRLLCQTNRCIWCSSIPRRWMCYTSAIPCCFFASMSLACVRQRNKEIRRSVGGSWVHMLQSTRFRLTKFVGCWAGREWTERVTNTEVHLLTLSLFFFFFLIFDLQILCIFTNK
jgi:hypothetical protein